MSASVASGCPIKRFSRTLAEKSVGSSNAKPTWARKLRKVRSRTSWPSSVTFPAGRVVESREQRRDGRLAGTGHADERERLARMNREVEPAQHGLLASGVGKVHVVESHFAVGAHERRRVRAVGDERLGVEHLPYPAGRGLRLLRHREDPSQLLDGKDEYQQVRHERDEAAHGQRAGRHRQRAGEQHGREREVRDQAEHPDELRVDLHPFELGLTQLTAAGVVATEHLVAPAERLQDADATRGFLEHGREIAGLVLDVAHDDVVRAFEPATQHQHRESRWRS